ncbi:MAG: anthranilate phosphoribosyltransferase [Dehalococcoidia bacterium]|nr:anthranilate phosphoribosyltransferase [Dehalococcoidia bacterium]
MIRGAIESLVSGSPLSMEEASTAMREIMEGEVTPAQLGAFLTALRVKGETPEEIAGMATIMREKSLKVDVDGVLVDTCGTGGDGKGTFNVSTAASFVASASGLKVAKHGNRAASGSCGSADVLEALGVKIDLGPEGVKRCIEEVGIGFMFAPTFHPAMRHAAPVRREIGIRTVFNLMGPLTNPAGAQRQLAGVPDPSFGDKMAEVLVLLGSQHSLVVHGEDGLDELTLGARTRVWEVHDGVIHSYTVSPDELDLPWVSVEEIKGGDPAENAVILRRLFQGEKGPIRDVVLLNSAAILMVGGKAQDLKDGIGLAGEAIDSGESLRRMEALVELSFSLAP